MLEEGSQLFLDSPFNKTMMKKIIYILPILLLSSCFFTVGDLPPDFCDISQSKVVKDDGAAVRCGDATVEYTYNSNTGLYKLILTTSRMVPSDNGSEQPLGMRLELEEYEPISSGDFLNNANKGWRYSFSWYDYYVSITETNALRLKINADGSIEATVDLNADLAAINDNSSANFIFTFRNIQLPENPNPNN